MPNESELLLALRNSDGHGDNEVLIDEIDEQIIEFACKGNIKEINMNNNDFSNLLANKSKEMYLKSLDTEYGLIKKNYEEESTVESPITNENELDIVLKKFEIAKFKDKVSEIENDEDIKDKVDNYHQEILLLSRVLGANAAAVLDENGSQSSSNSQYTNSITKKSRVQEIKSNIMLNVKNFYTLQYIKLLFIVYMIVTLIFTFVYIFKSNICLLV